MPDLADLTISPSWLARLTQLERIETLALRIGEVGEGETDLGPPSELQIFKQGLNRSANGYWILYDEEAAEQVDRAYKMMGHDLYIDYDHMMFRAMFLEGESVAAGWFTLGFREDGLWAEKIRWTPRALEHLRNLEYRYFSPTIGVGEAGQAEDGLPQLRATSVENMALTNSPALAGIAPLVAASKRYAESVLQTNKEEGEATMPETNKDDQERVGLSAELLKTLGLADDAGDAKVLEAIKGLQGTGAEVAKLLEALGSESTEHALGRIKGLQETSEQAGKQIEALNDRLEKLEQQGQADELEALISKAIRDGKLSVNQRAWAEGVGLETFKGFLEDAPVVHKLSKLQSKVGEPSDREHVITETYDETADRYEAAIAKEFGIDLESCSIQEYRRVQNEALRRHPELGPEGVA